MSTRARCRARPSIEAPSAGSTISGNRVTMSIFIWFAVGAPAPGLRCPTVGESPRDYSSSRPAGGRITAPPPPGAHVHVDHALGDRRDQMLALGALHDPEVLSGAWLDPREATDVAAVFGRHPSAFELPGIEAAGPGRQRLRGRHRDQPPDEGPRRLR